VPVRRKEPVTRTIQDGSCVLIHLAIDNFSASCEDKSITGEGGGPENYG
jgi:hypothetical protein